MFHFFILFLFVFVFLLFFLLFCLSLYRSVSVLTEHLFLSSHFLIVLTFPINFISFAEMSYKSHSFQNFFNNDFLSLIIGIKYKDLTKFFKVFLPMLKKHYTLDGSASIIYFKVEYSKL